ncbi:MAG: glutamyl-tRNA reductase [Candidatus Dormibacteria bacterium]
MHLVAAGLSFRSAPVSVRERAVVAEEETPRLLRYLVGHCGLRGAAVLSTCNRTEFYVSCPTIELADQVRPRLAQYLDPTDDGAVAEHLMELRDGEAIRHMLRVAAGLESMMVGEPQVLGQFRSAHRYAREAGTLDAGLDYVMRRALAAGKRVRTHTAIGRRTAGLAEAAVEVAGEMCGDLAGRSVLLVGAGATSALAARRLQSARARVAVASRSGVTASALAASLGEGVTAVSGIAAAAIDADVVISSTDSPEPVFTAADVARIQAARAGRELVLVDIAVPRDVEAAAASVPGVLLIDVDTVGARSAATHRVARAALAAATALIEGEVQHALTVVGERDAAGSTIGALVRHAEAVRRAEVERTLARMPDAGPETAERLHALTRSIVGKLLHAPIAHLRESADDPAVALTLRDAFELDADGTTAPAVASSDAAAS